MAEINANNVPEDQGSFEKLRKGAREDATSYDSVLRFPFMISLQNIVMAQIIINLWRDQYAKLVKKYSFDIWDVIQKNVVTQLSLLPLSESLINKLADIAPCIGNSIINWVNYNNLIFNEYGLQFVEEIGHIAWTVRGKINYAQTARNILADRRNILNDKLKYDLACTYCLEKEMQSLAMDQSFLHWRDFGTNKMVRFWTAELRSYSSRFNFSVHDDRIFNIYLRDKLFRLFMTKDKSGETESLCNEEAIKYMWKKFSEEQKTNSIIFAIKRLGNQDLLYSLLSSLRYKQQQNVLRECSDIILREIFNDWLWEEYFVPTALHAFPIMDPSSYLNILSMIIKRMEKVSEQGYRHLHTRYKSVFKQLWTISPEHLKNYFFRKSDGYFIHRLLMTSSCKDLITVLFKDSSSQQTNVGFRDEDLPHCTCFIQFGQWYLLDQFIEQNLYSEDYKMCLKKKIIQDKGGTIALRLVLLETFDEVDYFLSWGFKSKEEIGEFKLGLINNDTLLKSIIDNYNADYTKVEKFFRWCSYGDKEVMNRLITKFATSATGRYYILKLIEDYNYKLLRKFLNWCFLCNKKSIRTFKRNLYRDNVFAFELAIILRKKEYPFRGLSTFIQWSSTNDEGKQKLTSILIAKSFPRFSCNSFSQLSQEVSV